MFRLRVIPLFFVLGMLAMTNGMAQTEKGDSEFQVAGVGLFQFGDNGIKTVVLLANYGYFFTDRQELGGGVNFSFTDTGSGDSDTNVGANAFYRYNFARQGRTVLPYLSASVFSFDVSNSDSLGGRPGAGVKFFFKENAAFDINAGYTFPFTEPGDGFVDVIFGLSFLF